MYNLYFITKRIDRQGIFTEVLEFLNCCLLSDWLRFLKSASAWKLFFVLLDETMNFRG